MGTRGMRIAVLTISLAVVGALATAPAGASTVRFVKESGPYNYDYCGYYYDFLYTGGAGEVNQPVLGWRDEVDAPAFTEGPICWELVAPGIAIADSGAAMRAGTGCSVAGPAARCSEDDIISLTFRLNDKADSIRLLSGDPPVDVYGGPGNDTLDTADGTADRVYCGTGHDTVTADRADVLGAECEKITLAG